MLLLGRYGISEARVRQMSLPEMEIFIEAARALSPPYALPSENSRRPARRPPDTHSGSTRTLICKRKKL